MTRTDYQSTDRLCPECNDDNTEEEDRTYFLKDRWLLVCPDCYLCPKRTQRTPTTDSWQQFWEQRQERDGRVRPVGGYKGAYP